ncbi:MAG: enoyl-CoA hydratase-related protein [Cetobacterium sp.]
MEFKTLIFEKKNKIAKIIINRPHALNSLNKNLLLELNYLIKQIEEDSEIRVVSIIGSGEKAFVAGADIEYMLSLDPLEAKLFGKMGSDIFRNIEKSKKVYIALINGFALGGGCELAMACDIRIASKNAKFGQPEVGLGIIPGFSGTQRLPRIVGIGKAKELIFSGEIISAEEAYNINLVNYVVEKEDLEKKAEEFLIKILKNSFFSIKLAKEAINLGMQVDIDSGIESENNLFSLCFTSAEQKEGMKAFLEKRKANF